VAGTPAVTQLNVAEQRLVRAIEDQAQLDGIIDPLKQPLEQFLVQRAGLRSLLNGTWLGHAVHPVLTDIPIGAWTASCVLDLLDTFGVQRDLRQASDIITGVGLAGAVGAAVFGVADWSYTIDKAKRVGFVHGAINVAVTGLYAGSLVARSKGNRAVGVALSAVGYDLLLVSGWLGGELAYRFGLGVDHTAFQEGPTDWADVASTQDVSEGKLHRAEANGVPVLLTRYQGQVYAIGDTCSHLGCSLAEGELQQDMVVCPCHGSGFRITDGQVLQGPAGVSQPGFAVRTQGERIAVRRAGA
jgi:nitrite reductase/ring-hydroxylating ferredoxin subunit/uncharacterized membrane protein